jgi:hypothetical protein
VTNAAHPNAYCKDAKIELPSIRGTSAVNNQKAVVFLDIGALIEASILRSRRSVAS